mgnify:CR=1 FL=1
MVQGKNFYHLFLELSIDVPTALARRYRMADLLASLKASI